MIAPPSPPHADESMYVPFSPKRSANEEKVPMWEILSSLKKLWDHRLISTEQHEAFAAKFRPLDSISEEFEGLAAELLAAISKKAAKLSEEKFKLLKVPYPERIKAKTFPALVRKITERYHDHIQKTIHECAEANLDTHELVEVTGQTLLLPMRVQSERAQPSSSVLKLFTPLHAFFKERMHLLQTQQIMDDLERVIYHVCQREKVQSLSTERLLAIINISSAVWKLIHRCDLRFALEWKELIQDSDPQAPLYLKKKRDN